MRKILTACAALLVFSALAVAQVEDAAVWPDNTAYQTFEFKVGVLPYVETKDFAPFLGNPIFVPGSEVFFQAFNNQVVAYSNHSVSIFAALQPLWRRELNGGTPTNRYDILETKYRLTFRFNFNPPIPGENISWEPVDPGHPLNGHPHHDGNNFIVPPQVGPFEPMHLIYNWSKSYHPVPHDGNIWMTLQLKYKSNPASFNNQNWFQSDDSGFYKAKVVVTYTLDNFVS